MKLNWNFLGGAGCKTKKPSGGGGAYGYFLELYNAAQKFVTSYTSYRDVHNFAILFDTNYKLRDAQKN